MHVAAVVLIAKCFIPCAAHIRVLCPFQATPGHNLTSDNDQLQAKNQPGPLYHKSPMRNPAEFRMSLKCAHTPTHTHKKNMPTLLHTHTQKNTWMQECAHKCTHSRKDSLARISLFLGNVRS